MKPIAKFLLFRRSLALAAALPLVLLTAGRAYSADVNGTVALINFAGNNTYLITGQAAQGYWNNLGSGSTGSQQQYSTGVANFTNYVTAFIGHNAPLVDTNNGSTGWTLTFTNFVNNALNGDAGHGSSSTAYSNILTAVWPLTALEDGLTVRASSLTISGLNPSDTYTVKLYGNDQGDFNAGGKQTEYLAAGSSASPNSVTWPNLPATKMEYNTNAFAEWDNVTPNSVGQIIITNSFSSGFGAYNCMTVSNSTPMAGAATQLVFTSSPVTTAAGTASSTITVTREDGSGNPVTTDPTINVALSSTSTGTVTFNPASPVTIPNGSSTATFTYTDTKAGTPTITAISPGLSVGTQMETVTALPASTVTKTSGDLQTTNVTLSLGNAFVVKVTDSYGNPISGTNVTFAIASTPVGATGQSLTATTVATAGDGTASSTLTLGNLPGTYTVTATVGTLTSVTFTATATLVPGPAATVTITSGNNQTRYVTLPLASAFKVTVTDTNGTPVAGTNVTFAVASTPPGATGQMLSVTTVATAGDGTASSTLTLGNLTGTYTVTATVGTLTPATFTATAVPIPPTSALLNFSGTSGYSVTSPDGNGNYWNNITGGANNYSPGLDAIANNGGTSSTNIALVDTNNSYDGWTLSISNWLGSGIQGDLGGHGSASTPYSNNLTAIWPLAALNDGYGIHYNNGNPGISVYLSGLNPANTYNVLLYGYDPSQNTAQTNVLIGGSSPSPSSVTFPNVKFNTNMYAEWDYVTPTANGQIVIAINVGTIYTDGALNAMEVLQSVAPTPGVATTVTKTSGDLQTNNVGSGLSSPFTVTVTDFYGNPVSGTNVTFAIASTPPGATGQMLSSTTVSTAGNGTASSTLTLGNLAGTYTVTATVGTLAPVTFTATATASANPGSITAGVSGPNSLMLTWTANANIALQSATNLTPPVVWTDVPGTTGQGSATIGTTNSQMYFRLANP